MISSLASTAARRASSAASRSFHSTVPARGGGGYDYLHAEYMYHLRFKPASKLKAGLLIGGAVTAGVGIPIFAVWFNQKKAGLV